MDNIVKTIMMDKDVKDYMYLAIAKAEESESYELNLLTDQFEDGIGVELRARKDDIGSYIEGSLYDENCDIVGWQDLGDSILGTHEFYYNDSMYVLNIGERG